MNDIQDISNYIKEKNLSQSEYNILIDSLIEKDPEFKDLLDRLIDSTSTRITELGNLRPQGKIMRVLKIFALMQYEFIDKGIEELKKQMLVQTAENDWLDLHAKDHGTIRKIMTKATGKVWVGSKTKPDTIYTLPEPFIIGTKSSTDQDNLRFKVLGNVSIDRSIKPDADGDYVVSVSIEAESGGSKYNLSEESITEIFTKVPYFDLVKQDKPTSGGVDRESDNNFRNRIITKASNPVDNSIEWFKSQAESINGVRSAHVVPRINGEGTVGIIIKGTGIVTDELKNKVEKHFNNENIRPLANWSVFVREVKHNPVIIDITVYHNQNLVIDTLDIRNTIKRYFSTLDIGDSFIREKMESFVMGIPGIIYLKTNSVSYEYEDNKVLLADENYNIQGIITNIFVYNDDKINIKLGVSGL